MSVIQKSMARMDALYTSAQTYGAKRRRGGGGDLVSFNPFTPFQTGTYLGNQLSGASENRYSLFRGWVHAAVNALGMSGAGQSLQVGRMASDKGPGPGRTKSLEMYQRLRMPEFLRTKSSDTELEIILDHPIQKSLECPNHIQGLWQFTYNFIVNLNMTGWSFVVSSPKEDAPEEYEFYSIPTTWVRPDHTEGAFSKFYIVNPRNPIKGEPLTRDQVSFAYLPNPADPLAALSPAGAQMMGIKIDDFIQESQHNFFKNGIFPSVLVTVGKDPHPNVPSGIRPRLTPAQRRQVYGAISKVMAGVSNYGEPAILDGLIENVERISATQNEMGWEKSEKTVRTRILSAFGVHPFILGEEMAGSYAQAYIIETRFNERVNTYLQMLSKMMSDFVSVSTGDDKLMVWWEERKARAPDMEKATYEQARVRKDITQNEFRAWMGMPPDEDGNEDILPTTSIQAVSGIAAAVAGDKMAPEQAIGILEGMGVPSKLAKKIAGKPKPQPKPQPMPFAPGQPGAVPQQPGQAEAGEPPQAADKPQPGEPVEPTEPSGEPKVPKKSVDELISEFTKGVDGFVDEVVGVATWESPQIIVKKDMKTLYVSRPVQNRQDFLGWAKDQNLPVPDEDLHVTLAYSKKEVDWDKIKLEKTSISIGSERSIEILGRDSALVLAIQSPHLQKRHRYLRGLGASWDYEEYKPHITITYDTEGIGNLKSIDPYQGRILLGPEMIDEVS